MKLSFKRPKAITINRLLYTVVLLTVAIYAWFSGERVLYVGTVVLLLMPVLSYVVTFIMLRGLRVKQSVPRSIVKNEEGVFKVRLHNVTPMPFGHVECVFFGDEHAIVTEEIQAFGLRPFKPTVLESSFYARYRGQYALGLKMVRVTDIAGLFQLKRVFNKQVIMTVFPLVVDFDSFPLAMNLLTQAHSRFDIRDEDYATISDIRPYLPTDSIKRVHWKLTAKRNEWLVKIFQANALNQVSVILDSLSLTIPVRERYALEDNMVEASISLARFCLDRGMPVDFLVTDGSEIKTRAAQEFESIYHTSARLKFEPSPKLNPLAILTHVLNDATGYINATIFTVRLDKELFERILSAVGNGHYIAVVYFATFEPDLVSERTYRLLKDGNVPCFRVTEDEGIE